MRRTLVATLFLAVAAAFVVTGPPSPGFGEARLTAPGHALLGTGVPPAQSGIIANEWWLRDLERPA